MTEPTLPPLTPALLYGCMGLGGDWDSPDYGAAEIDQAAAVIGAALEIGITRFDHADIYTRGKAEAVFGEVLARDPGLRERITLQTKCGIRLGTEDRAGLYDLRRDSILRRVEESLGRLRVDVIDVLLLHRPDPLIPPSEVAEALNELFEQGRVSAFGVSNMSAAQIAALQRELDLPLVVNQLEMSLRSRDWVESGVLVNTTSGADNGFPHGTLEYCAQHGIALQAWGALAQGRYTGRPTTPVESATAELVTELARRHGTTPETIVLWWLQRHPAWIAPVVGTTDVERIRRCADAVTGGTRLTHEEWYRLWTTARGGPLP